MSYMSKTEFKLAQKYAINNKGLKHGLDLFEKYVVRIEWLHTKEEFCHVKSNRKFAVVNLKGETVFEADKMVDIAKEFCVSSSRISNCLNFNRLLNERYMIVRCEHE